MISDEEWRDIQGYEGYYQVSNLGRVRSLDRVVEASNRNIKMKGVMLKQHHNNKGYMFVVLCKKSKPKTSLIHQLVAYTFLTSKENILDGYVVDHIDENHLNNSLSNLQIISKRQNEIKSKPRVKRGAYLTRWGWKSQITIMNRSIHLGYFEDKEGAHNAYYNKYYEAHGNYPW